ncbi:hypothetical protein ACJRO7_033638 [Eucalyptus globulus]|uniref:Uncharacterized protein n=1 Tax=Eucalyptus globulus TaxID=34317 RepID=A0ABD3JUF7_EUCGL
MNAKALIRSEPWQLYGSEDFTSPYRMKWEELESLPPALKEIVLGTNGIEIGGWMPLYRYPNGMIRFISSFEFVPGHTLDDLEELLLHAGENSEEMDSLNFICSCAVDAVKAGRSRCCKQSPCPMYFLNEVFQNEKAIGIFGKVVL